MSSFVNVIIANDNTNINELKKKLIEYSKEKEIGLFFEDRFHESFENEIVYSHTCFSIADTNKFDNCEFLITPWWFDGHSIEQFVLNFKKIEGLLNLCLMYSETVDLWIGESGDLCEDFIHGTVKLHNLIANIQKEYHSNCDLGTPSIHYTIVL